jgi:ABC-type uncharacterized transport system permease subunit
MSLKAFHIFFVVISSALAFGFAAWSLKNYFAGERAGLDLAMGIGSSIIGIALVVYGKYFLKKLKNISYL